MIWLRSPFRLLTTAFNQPKTFLRRTILWKLFESKISLKALEDFFRTYLNLVRRSGQFMLKYELV